MGLLRRFFSSLLEVNSPGANRDTGECRGSEFGVMLDQPDCVLRAFGAVFRTAGPIRALMVRHQLEPRRDVFRVDRKLPFEPSYIGLLEF